MTEYLIRWEIDIEAEDGQSIYASNWILEQKSIV
jgi:hypothetical protein